MLADNPYTRFMLRWEELKALRIPHEARWRDIGTYCMRRKEVGPIQREGPAAPRNLVDKTAVTQLSRSSNIIHGYLFSPFAPFFLPRLADREPLYTERLWIEMTGQRMHRYMTGAKAPFRVSMGSAVYQTATLGTSPMWLGQRAGQPPTVLNISIWDAWLDVNPDTGLVDTIFRRFRKSAWRAAEDYPQADKIKKIAEKEPHKVLTFVLTIEPNPKGGRVGGPRGRKPYVEKIFCIDCEIMIAETGGYDEFPVPALRFYNDDDSAYGTGPGDDVLEMAKALNAIEDNSIQAGEQNANPALLDMTNGAIDVLDRRPGARVPFDPSMMGFNRDRKPFERMFDIVDLRDSHLRVQAYREAIKEACFTDWLTPREHGTQTATEVMDRRDVRLRAMASVVSGMERDFNQIGDRMFALLLRAGLLPEVPDTLHGEEIVFDFISPLRMAQEQGEVEKLMAYLELAGAAAAFDPMAARVANVESITREGGRKLGVSEVHIRSEEEIQAEREAQAKAEEAARELELWQQGATAFRDGAQGAASLANAGPGLQGAA